MKNVTRYCILGATGYIGNYLYRHMKEDGFNVIGSSRSQQPPYFKFDILSGDYCPSEFVGYEGAKVVIICFAQSKVDKCRLDYENAYKINVTETLHLIENLKGDGCKVVVFSSDNVFGDNRGNYSETDNVSPVNQYGEMKAELEKHIQQNYPEALILRLPKVVGSGLESSNLLTEYLMKLKKNEVSYAIKGSKMSIVSLEDIYHIIVSACEMNLSGLYQVCYEKSYSRADLANIFFSMLGIEKKIIEKELEDFHFEDTRPKRINMKNDKIKNTMQYSFQSYESIVKSFIEMNKEEINTVIRTLGGIYDE